jgi:hypothetical protein
LKAAFNILPAASSSSSSLSLSYPGGAGKLAAAFGFGSTVVVVDLFVDVVLGPDLEAGSFRLGGGSMPSNADLYISSLFLSKHHEEEEDVLCSELTYEPLPPLGPVFALLNSLSSSASSPSPLLSAVPDLGRSNVIFTGPFRFGFAVAAVAFTVDFAETADGMGREGPGTGAGASLSDPLSESDA